MQQYLSAGIASALSVFNVESNVRLAYAGVHPSSKNGFSYVFDSLNASKVVAADEYALVDEKNAATPFSNIGGFSLSLNARLPRSIDVDVSLRRTGSFGYSGFQASSILAAASKTASLRAVVRVAAVKDITTPFAVLLRSVNWGKATSLDSGTKFNLETSNYNELKCALCSVSPVVSVH